MGDEKERSHKGISDKGRKDQESDTEDEARKLKKFPDRPVKMQGPGQRLSGGGRQDNEDIHSEILFTIDKRHLRRVPSVDPVDDPAKMTSSQKILVM
ncbi:hypothetical protein L596_013374 [Steinernema carpocapsae]|uniref:Uncharacterized protein n=1 Tax=Steinernema carpocapsae TaxID=34508 RepID=A0A4U5P001_STECR|nr:hypothetical protein L596_013374 [Steinernema carpocapsae]